MTLFRLAATAILATIPALAQPGAEVARSNVQETTTDPVFRADTTEVVLHVTVADKKDRLVTNLKKSDFEVYEDGQRVPLKIFRQEDVPVSVGILVDNSGSMRDKRLRVNAAAVEFVRDSNPDDEVFIVNFNDEAYLDSPFTNDVGKLQDALQRIDSRGGTALYDAARMSLDHLNDKAKHDKRVLLIITDGEDNASRTELEMLVRELQEMDANQTQIYAIGLLGEEEKRSAKRAERAIKYITRATGGPAYFPETVDEVKALTHQIALDIRNQYTVVYTPPEGKPSGFRQIKVELVGDAKKNSVRHRPGYYAN